MKPVQVEQTSKRYKGPMLAFGLVAALGVPVAFGDPFWGGIMIIVGLVGNSAARIAAWWGHG